jgi:hypothetical protein
MILTGRSNTIVIQTFRSHTIPAWIQRCLESVQKWAALHEHDYWLAGDEFYDLCGPEYLARGNKNPQAITNLARLVATRQRLDAGYECVIWMDADVFVFDPANLVFDFPAESLSTGYAFGREVWLFRDSSRVIRVKSPSPHNAATFFTQGAVDLDMLITLIRHIDATRKIVSNYQVGVRLLHALQYSLMFPTFSHVGMFSPVLLRALAERDEKVLELAAGDAVNKYATETGIRLVPYNCDQSATFMWRSRLKAALRLKNATSVARAAVSHTLKRMSASGKT